MAIPSSQIKRSENKMVTEREVMPVDLFRAAMKGNSDVLILRLRLLPKESQEIKLTIEASNSVLEEINIEKQPVQSELQSATHFGDTILHILITEGHNELALMVFDTDMSLLKAQNNMLETPLYCAAKVGNEKVILSLIQSNHAVVKDALGEKNKNGDTALHVAARHGHSDIGRVLMNLDPKVAYKVNDELRSPLYMAIIEGRTVMVQTMLEVDPTLACTPFSDGMFPVHEVGCMGNRDLAEHLIENYPDDAELRDPRGRNLFHIAAEENHICFFSFVYTGGLFRDMTVRMNTAANYEGNTPFHIAAMKGDRLLISYIWKSYQSAEIVPNKQGLTPFQLSAKEVVKTNQHINDKDIRDYIETEGSKFSRKWFDEVMVSSPITSYKWEKTQVIALGSVLITTVSFAAAFTIPGGYNQDEGTPFLGRRYMFRAFILANSLAFIQGFVSLFVLLCGTMIMEQFYDAIWFATVSYLFAASSMVVAFGLGMYVTLASVCYPIAVFLLIISLSVGSPAIIIFAANCKSITRFLTHTRVVCKTLGLYALCFIFIFCLALL